MRIVAPIILYSLLSVTCYCQQEYSLEDCFSAAKESNVGLKKSRNEIMNSILDKRAATFSLFPAVTANAEHIFSAGKNIDPVTNSFVRDNFSGGDFDITFQLNIFSGFKTLNAIKGSLYKIKANEYAYEKNEIETFSSVTIAYAKLMYAKEAVAIIKNNNQHTRDQLNVVQQNIEVGKLSKSDLYTVNTRFKAEQADLAQAQNDVNTAMNELKYLIGFNTDRLFDVKNIDSNEIKDIETKTYNATDLLRRILTGHPALQESVYAEKSAERNVKSAKGNAVPNISLTGNIFSNYNLTNRNTGGDKIEFGKQLNNNLGKMVSLLVEIPLFNRNQNRIAIEKEKINLTNAKLTEQQTEKDVTKDVLNLLNNFISSQKEYLLQTEALQQGELAYKSFEERYKLGYISSLELILAKDQLYGQQVKTTQAKYNMYFNYKLIQLLLPLKK